MPRWVPVSLFGMERPSMPIGPATTVARLPVSRAAASSCERVQAFFKTPRARTGAPCFSKTPLPMPLPVGLRFSTATRRSKVEGGRFMSRTICCCCRCHRAGPFPPGTVRTILLWATVPPKAVPWPPLGPKYFCQTNAIAVPIERRTVVVSAVLCFVFWYFLVAKHFFVHTTFAQQTPLTLFFLFVFQAVACGGNPWQRPTRQRCGKASIRTLTTLLCPWCSMPPRLARI